MRVYVVVGAYTDVYIYNYIYIILQHVVIGRSLHDRSFFCELYVFS